MQTGQMHHEIKWNFNLDSSPKIRWFEQFHSSNHIINVEGKSRIACMLEQQKFCIGNGNDLI